MVKILLWDSFKITFESYHRQEAQGPRWPAWSLHNNNIWLFMPTDVDTSYDSSYGQLMLYTCSLPLIYDELL